MSEVGEGRAGPNLRTLILWLTCQCGHSIREHNEDWQAECPCWICDCKDYKAVIRG